MTEQDEKIADLAASVIAAINDRLKESSHNKMLWLRFRSKVEQALLLIGKQTPRIPRENKGDIFKPVELAKVETSIQSSDVIAYSKTEYDIKKPGRPKKNGNLYPE
jgi:hypothetical protein